MAIAYTSLATASSTTDATSYATAAFTPTANRIVCAGVSVCRVGAAADAPSISGGGGITNWTEIGSNNHANASGGAYARAWYGWTASPSSAATTFSVANTHTGAAWWIFEVTDGRLEAPRLSNIGSGAGNWSIDVGTALSTSGLFGIANKLHATTPGTHTAGTGYTEAQDVTISATTPACRAVAEYDITAETDGIVDGTWSATASMSWVGVAWEIALNTPSRVPVNLAASAYVGR